VKTIILIMSVLFIANLVYSAEIDVDYSEWTCDPVPYFYSNNRLSTVAAGRGYTGVADSGDLSLSTINPASFYNEKKFQFYFEYSTKNDAIWLEGYADYAEFKKNKSGNILGFGVSLDNFQGGLFYAKPRSYKYALKQYYYDYFYNEVRSSVLTAEHSQGSFVLPLNYYIDDFARIGVSLDVSKYISTKPTVMYYPNGGVTIVDGSVEFFLGRAKYGVVFFPEENYSFGISFLPEVKKVIFTDYGSAGQYKHAENSFPMELTVGAKYNPHFLMFKRFTAFLDYKFSNNSVYEEVINRNDFHIGLEFKPNSRLIIRTGFFTQNDYRDMNATYIQEDQYGVEQEYHFWPEGTSIDENFVTLGTSYILKTLKFNIAYMNGSMLSTGDLKQHYFNLGFEMNFDNPNKTKQ
jgi:hypothetical protein